MILGYRQHPPGPARRVEDGLDGTRVGQDVVVLGEQEVHHQADDLTGGEVLTGCLVGQFRKLTDQFLVQVTHLNVGHHVGVQVHLGELAHHPIEQVALVHATDLGIEVELFDDLTGTGREPGDVAPQVPSDLTGIVQKFGEVHLGRVEELLLGDRLHDRVDVVHLALQLVVTVQGRGLGGFEHAVEPTQHRQGQDDLGVVRGLVVPTQQVGDRPDESSVVLGRGIRHCVVALCSHPQRLLPHSLKGSQWVSLGRDCGRWSQWGRVVLAVGPPTAPRTPAGSVRGGGQNQVLGGRHVHHGANLVPVGGGHGLHHVGVLTAFDIGSDVLLLGPENTS